MLEISLKTSKHLGGHADITHVDAGAVAALTKSFPLKTILDLGCGPGDMRNVAGRFGLQWIGIDGDPRVASSGIISHDFNEGPIHWNFTADIVWCVEFVEHVGEMYVDNYLSLLQNAGVLVLTAAPRGATGHHHVNCQNPEYWIGRIQTETLRFHLGMTDKVRQASTMKRDFIRSRGMVFVSDSMLERMDDGR